MEKYYENDPGNSNTLELNPPSTQISNLLFLASSHKIGSTFNLWSEKRFSSVSSQAPRWQNFVHSDL